LIVIFVPHRTPVAVFETTKAAIGLMATDSSAGATHTSSIPPGLLAGDFATCWAVLTKDLQFADYFATVEAALDYFDGPKNGLTIQQHAAIVSGLRRIEAKRVSDI
jgi:hypothetical protein